MVSPLTGMFLTAEDRQSDSPLVERVWSARSECAGQFWSIAEGNCEVVVTRHRGHSFMTIRGPRLQ